MAAIKVSWSHVAGSAPAYNFQVYRASVDASNVVGAYTLLGSVPVATTTYTDAVVTWGNKYAYKVVAKNIGGEPSEDSEVVMTVVSNPPAAPSNVTLQVIA